MVVEYIAATIMIGAMWGFMLLYMHTDRRLAAVLWPWNNHSMRVAILGRSNWRDVANSGYVKDGYFNMARYIENLGAPDFLKMVDGEGTIRLCTPEKGVFFDLYFSDVDGEKMLTRIEKVRIRNIFEYWLMPSSAVYSLTDEAKRAQPYYEYVATGKELANIPDFMLTGEALTAFCHGMSELVAVEN